MESIILFSVGFLMGMWVTVLFFGITEDEKKMSYSEYLQSKAWKEKARQVRERDGNRCQDCDRRGNLDVHHLHYKNIFREKPEDLVTLCCSCHQKREDKVKAARYGK